MKTETAPRQIRRHERPPQMEAPPLVWSPEGSWPEFDPAEVFTAGLRHHHLANTAYPIAHRKTIWEFRRDASRHAGLIRAALAGRRFCLYLHVPFCERRCAFCEYCVLERHDEAVEAAYFAALEREAGLCLDLLGSDAGELAGLDVGGGTPLLAAPERLGAVLDRILRRLRPAAGFGMSIETTPRLAARHPGRLAAVRALGIERISMGLQTASARLLAAYGRDINSVGDNRPAVENIRRAGFRRLNVDLMYGLAQQTVADIDAAVRAAVELGPEYITLYRMRYKGTRVAGEAAQVELERVNAMHERARKVLLAAGYDANPGKNAFSRVQGDPGTSAYLTERVVRSTPYLGLGLGAQTFTNNLLAYNHGAATKTLDHYLAAVAAGELPIQDLYHLPPSEGMGKMLAVSFYFGMIHRGSFREKFGRELDECFPVEIAFLEKRGLMINDGQILRLTPAGVAAFSGAIAQFYSPRVKAHLLSL